MPTLIIRKKSQPITLYQQPLGQSGSHLDLVLIPAGQFWMGKLAEEEGDDDELPRHLVTVTPFLLGQTPITQEQWQVVAQGEKVVKELELNPSRFSGEQRPVEQVSWQDAIEFCARLRRDSQRDYCLPTEAQWEYACRAGTTTPFSFGETLTPDLANYDGNYDYGRGIKGTYRGETTVVKALPANEWGLYGMHGNVYEWCLDPWHDSYEDKAQTDSEVWDEQLSLLDYTLDRNKVIQLNSDKRVRVLRGGSWLNRGPRLCRSANRNRFNPDDRYFFNGFRVACRFPSP